MTLHEIATQLHNLTFGGHVNGEKFTKTELEQNLKRWLRNAGHNKIPGKVVIEVCLADGRWLATVERFDNTADGYDYWIPDTREQENRIRDLLVS